MTIRFGGLVGVVGLVAIAVLPGPSAFGAADPAAQEKAQRQQTESRKQQATNELNELKASDDQLKAELDRLAARIRDEEAKAIQARADSAAARAQIDVLSAEVTEAEKSALAARKLAADRAIDAYMRPDRETATQMLAAKDPQQIGKMRVLVTDVGEYNHSVMQNRIAAETEVKVKRGQVQAAQDQADRLTAEAEANLAEAARLRDRQAAVRTELEKRIESLRTEVGALAAQEEQLAKLIADRERDARANPAIAAAPDQTVAPSTNASPTTTRPAPTTTQAQAGPAPVANPPTTATPTTAAPRPTGGMLWPTSGVLTSPFGPRWGTFHKGIDIGANTGTPIKAATGGVVFFSGVMSGYGNVILIDHGNGLVTLYGHQSQLIAADNQRVSQGQTIGLVGSTGNSTGPHLHFEVRRNGTAVDPMPYVS